LKKHVNTEILMFVACKTHGFFEREQIYKFKSETTSKRTGSFHLFLILILWRPLGLYAVAPLSRGVFTSCGSGLPLVARPRLFTQPRAIGRLPLPSPAVPLAIVSADSGLICACKAFNKEVL
jgi:hypothetical protein